MFPPASVDVDVEVLGKEHTCVGGSLTGVFNKECTELGLAELPGPWKVAENKTWNIL